MANYNRNKKNFGFTLTVCLSLLCVGAAAFIGLVQQPEPVPLDNPSSVISRPTQSAPQSAPSTSSQAPAQPDREPEPEYTPEPEQPTSTPVAGYFVLPITGDIIKPFDAERPQYSLTYKDYRVHKALDIAAEIGSEVRSAGDGTVLKVYTDSRLGNVIEIDHGVGITSLYCSVENSRVEEGDQVEANQVLGTLGIIPSESVEQVHLHFAVIKDGVAVSPAEMIDAN